MPWSSLLIRVRMAARLFATLRGLEKFLRINAQIRHVRGLPVVLGVRARQSLARVRVFDHPSFIPDEAPGVEFVLNDACAALHVAIDCGGIP